MTTSRSLPVIDVAPLRVRDDEAARARIAREIEAACRDTGFFYAKGHAIPAGLFARLDALSRLFFALPQTEKMKIAMARGGRAWRGYFPIGGELTSGRPDLKEGLYFGEELPRDHPRVAAGAPLHGPNLFPEEPNELASAVLAYMRACEDAAHAIMEGIALSLDLEADYFRDRYTAHPTTLFRIFRYPPSTANDDSWGVGEHTDYGLLTLLAQDGVAGLQVKTKEGWIEAPPVEGALVCNIGDMLDRLTGGWYRSTPHRVRNESGVERLSFPFFFDPDFEAEIEPLPNRASVGRGAERWDARDLHAWRGKYGAYLMEKVGKVFPDLGRDNLPGAKNPSG